jgi:hypothetical protein
MANNATEGIDRARIMANQGKIDFNKDAKQSFTFEAVKMAEI